MSKKYLCDYHDDYYEMADCEFHEIHDRSNMGRRCKFWNIKTAECSNKEKIEWEKKYESTKS